MTRRWRPLAGLSKRNLARELGAGVTLLAISVPLNIGYAQIAGLPASAGLYALIVPSLLFALLASSRQMVVAPDAAASALVASSLAGLAGAASGNYAAMAAAQALLGGALFLICGRLKLGFLANFLSTPILVGFVGGLALDITVSQIAKMLGVPIDSSAEFLEKTVELVAGIAGTNPWSLLLSVACLLVLVVGRRISRAVPWALIVMVAATVLTALLHLEGLGIAVLGEVPAGPPVLSIPMLHLTDWISLLPSALALTAITVAEGLMIARKYAEQRGYPNVPDRDLLALGAANLGAGISGGFTVGASTSRTAAMDDAGSRTQLPSIVLAVGALALLLFGTSLLASVPSPAIGAIVAFAVFRLLGIGELREIGERSKAELFIALACFGGVLLLGPLLGLILAFVLALIDLARVASAPRVEVLLDPHVPEQSLLDSDRQLRETAPGVVVIRLASPIFFANASATVDQVARILEEAPHPVRTLVCDFEAVTAIDVTGGNALRTLREDLDRRDVTVFVSRLRPSLQQRLERHSLLDGVSIYATNREAFSAAMRSE